MGYNPKDINNYPVFSFGTITKQLKISYVYVNYINTFQIIQYHIYNIDQHLGQGQHR